MSTDSKNEKYSWHLERDLDEWPTKLYNKIIPFLSRYSEIVSLSSKVTSWLLFDRHYNIFNNPDKYNT